LDLFPTAISSQLDTHVSHSVLPGSAEAARMTDTSGLSFLPLLKAKDPLGAFSKMFLGMSLWASTRCYLTWRGKATPRGRSLFQLVPRTHLTDEIDSGSSVEMWRTPMAADGTHNHCLAPSVVEGKTTLTLTNQVKGGIVGLWATPNTMDHLPQRSQEALEKQANTTRKGRARPSNLREQVNPETVEAWEKAQEPQMWPTPTASLEKQNTKEAYWENRIQKGRQEDIQMRVYKETGSGSLNPQWVEWLMGYPEGWTDLKD